MVGRHKAPPLFEISGSAPLIDDIEVSSDSDEKILIKKIEMEKNSDYEENFDEEILKKSQMKKKILMK